MSILHFFLGAKIILHFLRNKTSTKNNILTHNIRQKKEKKNQKGLESIDYEREKFIPVEFWLIWIHDMVCEQACQMKDIE